MLNAQFRPLDQWPGERTRRQEFSHFKVTYERTLDLLESELSKLRAKNITIQVDALTLDSIRNDGWPKSSFFNTRYAKCGVIISFESSKGPISMPCDKFNNWQDNLRAIAKSLEALRMVDRYGVTRGNEQYRGWARLEAPSNGKMTWEQANEFLRSILGFDWNPLDLSGSFRKARAYNHPDRAVGHIDKTTAHEIFVKIGQAEEVLCNGR